MSNENEKKQKTKMYLVTCIENGNFLFNWLKKKPKFHLADLNHFHMQMVVGTNYYYYKFINLIY